MIEIRVTHNEIGMMIEARNGGEWLGVELQKYHEYPSRTYGWGHQTAAISPVEQENEYFAMLDRRGISYKRIR